MFFTIVSFLNSGRLTSFHCSLWYASDR